MTTCTVEASNLFTPPPLPDNEAQRLAVLQECSLLDTAPEDAFDDITRLAAYICNVPLAAVSLIDSNRQWFKSVHGMDGTQTSRDMAFCAYTILQPDVMVVPDAREDARFFENPLVTGDPKIRFYAGAPLLTSEGLALGSLCVIDIAPRRLNTEQEDALRVLARQVSSQIELRRRVKQQEELIAEREWAEARVRRSEARLRDAQRVARIGSWEYDIATGDISWSEEMFRLLEFDPTLGEPSYDELISRYHPDDVPLHDRCVAQAIQDGQPYEFDIRVNSRDGSIRWLHASGNSEREAMGRVVRLLGTVIEITESKQAALTLEKQRQFQDGLLESLQEGIVACDAEGMLTLFNHTSRTFHGLIEEPLPPEQWAEHFNLYNADGLTPMRTQDIPLFRALKGETVRDIEMVIAPYDGPARTMLASGQAIYNTQGEKMGAVVAMHDITERRQVERELERLAAIVDSSEEAITSHTLDGTFVSWNAGAQRLFGYAASEIIGQHASVLVTTGEISPVPGITARLLRGETIDPIEVTRRRKDGAGVDIALSFSPIRDASSVMIGLSCIARDISARKRAEAALTESEARLRSLSDAAFEGIAVTEGGILRDGNSAYVKMFGYDSMAEMANLSVALLVAPESRGLILEKLTAGDTERYEAVLQRKDGSTFVAEIQGRMIQYDGRPARVIAIRDISEYKALAEGLQRAQERLEMAQALAHVGSWEIDCRSGDKHWSPEMFRIFGLTPVAEPPMDWSLNIVHPDDRARLSACMREALAHGTPFATEHRILWPDGTHRDVQARCEPIRDPEGALLALRGTSMDITERRKAEQTLTDFAVVLEFQKQELERANAELESLATIDGLTGLRNRRAFDARLQEEFERATRYRTPLSLVLLDIDHFKQYNDAYGHPAGDEVLRLAGRILQKAKRETDFLARYGGEEFAIILPETDGDGAMMVAERIRLAIATAGGEKREITASLGVCTRRLDMEQPKEMVGCADQALYRAKEGGRNRVMHGYNSHSASSATFIVAGEHAE